MGQLCVRSARRRSRIQQKMLPALNAGSIEYQHMGETAGLETGGIMPQYLATTAGIGLNQLNL